MSPEELSELDESSATLVDMWGPMWRRLYLKLLEEGFNEIESFKLVQTQILSQCPNGIRGDDG